MKTIIFTFILILFTNNSYSKCKRFELNEKTIEKLQYVVKGKVINVNNNKEPKTHSFQIESKEYIKGYYPPEKLLTVEYRVIDGCPASQTFKENEEIIFYIKSISANTSKATLQGNNCGRWGSNIETYETTIQLAQKEKLSKFKTKLTKSDQQALAIGQAILRLNELGSAGAPSMTDSQKIEFEKHISFLSRTKSRRMTWAWLEFRFKADAQLKLEGNQGAEAIKQRLILFKQLINIYFVLE